ncbi:hypothetical protein ONS95_000710 [Cadophora gregata]|uniref:uncharacterized protein n=1 Tax=Cadophora gregata TaxID=51156 RepID=UPI0026DD33A3|nr:uncharacterized protein ONS95_000710 [Cadophora gregata]KAK0128759.1 hypothetical protein ONS95_000710 [Cadophora gregata]
MGLGRIARKGIPSREIIRVVEIGAQVSNTTDTNAPCGIITQSLKEYYSNDDNKGKDFPLKPSLAYACLQSSAIDNKLAASYTEELKEYYQFQSSIVYLKNPPADYYYSPVDLLGGLDDIASKAVAGGFANDVYAVWNNFSVSSIQSINGEDIDSVLTTAGEAIPSDPDVTYNRLMWNYGGAPSAGSFLGAYSIPNTYQYPGDFTNLTFSNDTTLSIANLAIIPNGGWSTDIVDGKTFTEFFCIAPANPSPTSSSSSPSSTSTPTYGTTAPTLLGYNSPPVVKDPHNQVAGYYMNTTGYEDTAILRIGTFANETAAQADFDTEGSFVNTTREFFSAVRADNKTKLIIDVSGNGGGNTILPNDIFRRIFPDIEPYGLARLRDEALAISASDNDTVQNVKSRIFTSPWSYQSWVTEDLQHFTGWSAGDNPYYPPVENNGDNFTISGRIPTNSTFYTETTGGLILYGTPVEPATEPGVFTPENVVDLTDGVCTSACAILVEFLTRQANVKTIVVGGRGKEGPMQAIGGTKGAQAYTFDNLVSQTAYLGTSIVGPYISDELLALANDTLPGLNPLPFGSQSALAEYGINLRDSIPPGDDAGIPLQFVFEPVNCRIYYTPVTVDNPRVLWEQVYDIAWNGGKCNYGSINSDFSNKGSGVDILTGNNGTAPPVSNSVAGMGASMGLMLGALSVAFLAM